MLQSHMLEVPLAKAAYMDKRKTSKSQLTKLRFCSMLSGEFQVLHLFNQLTDFYVLHSKDFWERLTSHQGI